MNTRAVIASQIRQAQTPAEELRQLLGRLEAEVGKLGLHPEDAAQDRPAEILTMLDRANELLDMLTAAETNLEAERGRFNTITQQFRKKGSVFLRRIGGREALHELRMGQTPPDANWWWAIDAYLAGERSAQRRRTLRTAGILAVTIAMLSGLYALFLAPDKATRESSLHQQLAENALMQGNFATALSEIEQALTYAPSDPTLEVTRGVALELLGRQTEADQVFTNAAQAYRSSPDLAGREGFYSARAQAYLMANAADRALTDTQTMVELNPDSALGYFQMGNVNATLGNVAEAVQDYQKASELASASGDTQIEAMARVQLANTMMMSDSQLGTPSPTP